MAIAKVQSVTGSAATIVLNGVVAGNLLTFQNSYFRNPSTGAAEALPADSNGTFEVGRSDIPQALLGADSGASIFFEKNAAAGTHTVTPEANGSHLGTLTEWSGLNTTSPLDVSTSGKNSGTGTSQATGTTGATAQAEELSLIAFGMSAGTGSSNVGLTDPVASYTTLQVSQNDATSVALLHAYQILSSVGTQSATFNWTLSDSTQWWQASIATLKATATAGNIAWVKA